MNKYEILDTIGEGAYGIVLKGRHRETNELVAIKRFKESEEDELVRKTTLREVKLLRALRNEPYIVQLIEAFRRKGKLYLVFEYVGCNLLEHLENYPNGLEHEEVRRMVFTLLCSIRSCHTNAVIHRDIKPENLLVNPTDKTLQLCDFGFARNFAVGQRDMTDYVATRWYRSPELLLGTTDYTLACDIWAVGCIMAELLDGQALFPGETELDQCYLIQKILGNYPPKMVDIFEANERFKGAKLVDIAKTETTVAAKFGSRINKKGTQLLSKLLVIDPTKRLVVDDALRHPYFDGLAAELCPRLIQEIGASQLPTHVSRPGTADRRTQQSARALQQQQQQQSPQQQLYQQQPPEKEMPTSIVHQVAMQQQQQQHQLFQQQGFPLSGASGGLLPSSQQQPEHHLLQHQQGNFQPMHHHPHHSIAPPSFPTTTSPSNANNYSLQQQHQQQQQLHQQQQQQQQFLHHHMPHHLIPSNNSNNNNAISGMAHEPMMTVPSASTPTQPHAYHGAGNTPTSSSSNATPTTTAHISSNNNANNRFGIYGGGVSNPTSVTTTKVPKQKTTSMLPSRLGSGQRKGARSTSVGSRDSDGNSSGPGGGGNGVVHGGHSGHGQVGYSYGARSSSKEKSEHRKKHGHVTSTTSSFLPQVSTGSKFGGGGGGVSGNNSAGPSSTSQSPAFQNGGMSSNYGPIQTGAPHYGAGVGGYTATPPTTMTNHNSANSSNNNPSGFPMPYQPAFAGGGDSHFSYGGMRGTPSSRGGGSLY